MPHSQLRRTRGSGLELHAPTRARRPCAAAAGTGSADAARGRYAVAAERLGGDTAALRLTGELDLAALPALEAALRRVERWSSYSVLVDATDVGFIDLSVITRLAAAHRRLDAAGGGILVIHPPDCLLRVLDLLEDIELPVLQ